MKKRIYLAGGCFWGTQKFFDQFEGVISTQSGYANGLKEDPTYEEVCNGSCHAETVRIDFDDSLITLRELLDYYFMVIDPVSINQQGNDLGLQYRTGIYYDDESLLPALWEYYDKKLAEIPKLAVELKELINYYPAEEYHQKYLDKNPEGYCHIPWEMMRIAKKKAIEDEKLKSCVSRADDGDIDGILSLLLQVDMVHHKGRPDLFKGPATKYNKEELKDLLKDESRPVFVFKDESGRVLGHAFCIIQQHLNDNVLTDVKTLYIDDICVDENERQRHIGSALYRYVIGFAKEQGCYNVTLNVWECNPSAKAFYEAMGMDIQKTCMEKIL